MPLDAKAVAINVTIAGPTAPGYLSLWPAGTTQPLVSTINFTAADYALANGAVVPLAVSTPDLAVYFWGSPIPSTVHLILDVNGYFR